MKPLDITFDISDVVKEFSLSQQQIGEISNATSRAVTLEIRRCWAEEAKVALNSTRDAYIRGLIIAEEGIFTNTITLTGRLNNMLENGCSAFDMKTGFMKSAKVSYTKAGNWYMTIPFRFATPDALGENSAFADILPQEIYDIVKDYEPQKTSPDGSKTSAQSLKSGDIPTEYLAPKSRNSVINDVINKTFDSYTHKSSIYEGMQRSQKDYESAGQSTYNTFRRVSANSDPMSWIHGGLPARNLSQKAIENSSIDVVIDNTVDKILSDFGFGQ